MGDSPNQMIELIEVDSDEEIIGVKYDEEVDVCGNTTQLSAVKRAKRNWRKCLGCDAKTNLLRPSKEMRIHICKSKHIYRAK